MGGRVLGGGGGSVQEQIVHCLLVCVLLLPAFRVRYRLFVSVSMSLCFSVSVSVSLSLPNSLSLRPFTHSPHPLYLPLSPAYARVCFPPPPLNTKTTPHHIIIQVVLVPLTSIHQTVNNAIPLRSASALINTVSFFPEYHSNQSRLCTSITEI